MKLSVLMITYNHEQFIAKALDSILMQKVDFEYEIVIGEDCSTDGTRRILVEYKKKYPDKINLLLPEKNLGMIDNFVQTFKCCQGEFIAILEGDDYWTSPVKLQSQVDFLDNNLHLSSCFHNVVRINHESKEEMEWYKSFSQSEYTTADLLHGNFIAIGSFCFRKTSIEDFPVWLYKIGMADWIVCLINSLYGPIGYIDKIMGVYTIHNGGVWSSKTRLDNLIDEIYAAQHIKQIIDPNLLPIIGYTIAIWRNEIISIIRLEKNMLRKNKLIQKCLSKEKLNWNKNDLKYCIKMLLIGFSL